MPSLPEVGRGALYPGDVIRLPENYDLGPDSGPVDLILYNPNIAGSGLGLLTVSGYKAGLTYAIFPEESGAGNPLRIDMDWLKIHWDTWFCYEWNGRMRAIDIARTAILEWDRRMIVETD